MTYQFNYHDASNVLRMTNHNGRGLNNQEFSCGPAGTQENLIEVVFSKSLSIFQHLIIENKSLRQMNSRGLNRRCASILAPGKETYYRS